MQSAVCVVDSNLASLAQYIYADLPVSPGLGFHSALGHVLTA